MAEQSLFSDYAFFAMLENWALGIHGTTVTASYSTSDGNLSANELLVETLDTAWRSNLLSTPGPGSTIDVKWDVNPGGTGPLDRDASSENQ